MNKMALRQPEENIEELIITRVFDAPREQVWRAWTDPQSVKKWWGPKDFTAPISEIDLRVGGKYFYCMRSPEGKDYYGTGIYREIVEPERLALTDSFADENGDVVPASYYDMGDDFPLELQIIVTFEAMDGKTEMTLRHIGLPPGEMSDLTRAGWNESFDKLADSLRENRLTISAAPGKQDVVLTRAFDAPRDLVWSVLTNPSLIPRWWGPALYTATVDKMDVTPGGAWRFVQRDAEGNEYAFHGAYHEVAPPERLVQTFEFEGMPGHVSLETLALEEQAGGRTKMTATSVFQTVEDREGMLEAGMTEEAAETWDRFAELLANIQ